MNEDLPLQESIHLNPNQSVMTGPIMNVPNQRAIFSQSGMNSRKGKRYEQELQSIVKQCVQSVSSSRFLNKQNKLNQAASQIQKKEF